jgi:hypothetical protein
MPEKKLNNLNITLVDLLEIRAKEEGNKIAFIFYKEEQRTQTS